MAKTLTVKDKYGNPYTLEYTRKSVEILERRGFKVSDIKDYPVINLPTLFEGAFLAHHKQIKKENSNGDDTFYRSYLTFSSGCLYTGGPASSYSPSNRLNFMAKNIYANDINVDGVAHIDYAQCETLVIPIDGSYGDVGGWLSALLTRIENLESRVKNL